MATNRKALVVLSSSENLRKIRHRLCKLICITPTTGRLTQGGKLKPCFVGSASPFLQFFLKNTLYISINFTPLTSFPFFILEHTKTVNLFTQVLTINKYRSTAKILQSQNKICQKTARKCLVFLSYETFQKELRDFMIQIM